MRSNHVYIQKSSALHLGRKLLMTRSMQGYLRRRSIWRRTDSPFVSIAKVLINFTRAGRSLDADYDMKVGSAAIGMPEIGNLINYVIRADTTSLQFKSPQMYHLFTVNARDVNFGGNCGKISL